ncbi:hypothetical protein [Acidaminococcus fermentans]|uniref:hypothetical protein n=1 Tax=Acidaminococcus fermentans TaxID=905 RepID=UPI00242E5565|nr:hypothetical protein [Acidaminococcus fermentans]MDD6288145.1 hypothetical protein [Acidaminococcus fermentans]
MSGSFQKGGIEFAALRLFLFPAVPVSGRMVMDNNALSGFIALATVELPFLWRPFLFDLYRITLFQSLYGRFEIASESVRKQGAIFRRTLPYFHLFTAATVQTFGPDCFGHGRGFHGNHYHRLFFRHIFTPFLLPSVHFPPGLTGVFEILPLSPMGFIRGRIFIFSEPIGTVSHSFK